MTRRLTLPTPVPRQTPRQSDLEIVLKSSAGPVIGKFGLTLLFLSSYLDQQAGQDNSKVIFYLPVVLNAAGVSTYSIFNYYLAKDLICELRTPIEPVIDEEDQESEGTKVSIQEQSRSRSSQSQIGDQVDFSVSGSKPWMIAEAGFLLIKIVVLFNVLFSSSAKTIDKDAAENNEGLKIMTDTLPFAFTVLLGLKPLFDLKAAKSIWDQEKYDEELSQDLDNEQSEQVTSGGKAAFVLEAITTLGQAGVVCCLIFESLDPSTVFLIGTATTVGQGLGWGLKALNDNGQLTCRRRARESLFVNNNERINNYGNDASAWERLTAEGSASYSGSGRGSQGVPIPPPENVQGRILEDESEPEDQETQKQPCLMM